MVTKEPFYTAEEFWKIAENTDQQLELVAGTIIEMSPSSPLNTVIAGRITTFLNNYVIKNNAGYVTVPDGGFKLIGDNIRQPDSAFISKARQPSLPDHFEIAPDLAVEVVSPNEDVLKHILRLVTYNVDVIEAQGLDRVSMRGNLGF
jgi:Uma2 family endonuclease